jgi:hypothetical protein
VKVAAGSPSHRTIRITRGKTDAFAFRQGRQIPPPSPRGCSFNPVIVERAIGRNPVHRLLTPTATSFQVSPARSAADRSRHRGADVELLFRRHPSGFG